MVSWKRCLVSTRVNYSTSATCWKETILTTSRWLMSPKVTSPQLRIVLGTSYPSSTIYFRSLYSHTVWFLILTLSKKWIRSIALTSCKILTPWSIQVLSCRPQLMRSRTEKRSYVASRYLQTSTVTYFSKNARTAKLIKQSNSKYLACFSGRSARWISGSSKR